MKKSHPTIGRSHALGIIAALLAAACSESAGNERGPEPAQITCKFASQGDPSSVLGTQELINSVSERLSAPQGGLWWIAEPITQKTIVAYKNDESSIELEVVQRNDFNPELDYPLVTVRVPADLTVGTRLRFGARVLEVQAKLAKLNFDEIAFDASYREDFGGTGFIVQLAPELRSRVLVEHGYVGATGANVQAGIQVLNNLLLADAPSLCEPPAAADAPELFVPMWTGRTKEQEDLAVFVTDADDLTNGKLVRELP